MIRIAICDDEKNFLLLAEQMLSLYMKDKDLEFIVDCFPVSSDLIDANGFYRISHRNFSYYAGYQYDYPCLYH